MSGVEGVTGKCFDDAIDSMLSLIAAASFLDGRAHLHQGDDPQDGHIIGPGLPPSPHWGHPARNSPSDWLSPHARNWFTILDRSRLSELHPEILSEIPRITGHPFGLRLRPNHLQ